MKERLSPEEIERRRREKLPSESPLKAERRVAELKKENQELHKQATTDPLTGLLNRRAYEPLRNAMFERLKKEGAEGKVIAVLAFDLDHFKSVNDTFGHATGDKVLEAFASILKKRVRRTDIAARLGGEEFAVVVETRKGGGHERAEEIRKDVESSIQLPDGRNVTVSVGVSETTDGRVWDRERLNARADEALYGAKEGGRNQTKVAGKLDDGPNTSGRIAA